MEVKIRPLVEADAYTSVKWRNDPEVFKYTGNTYNHEISIESELSWIRHAIMNHNEYRCAIIADGVYVGNIYLTDITSVDAEYHIFIGDKTYWNKGVAFKASLLIIDYAFSALSLQAINLTVRPQNTPAVNLYKRLGFNTISEDTEFIYMKKLRLAR